MFNTVSEWDVSYYTTAIDNSAINGFSGIIVIYNSFSRNDVMLITKT